MLYVCVFAEGYVREQIGLSGKFVITMNILKESIRLGQKVGAFFFLSRRKVGDLSKKVGEK